MANVKNSKDAPKKKVTKPEQKSKVSQRKSVGKSDEDDQESTKYEILSKVKMPKHKDKQEKIKERKNGAKSKNRKHGQKKKSQRTKTTGGKETVTLADDDDDDSEGDRSKLWYDGPKEDDVIGEQYKVIRKLGEGGFGAVFEVVHVKSNEHYAVKVELEKQPPDEAGLRLECQVLKRLQGYEHILRYIDDGHWGPEKIAYLIMELAGHSLDNLRKKRSDGCLSVSTTTRLAFQCMAGIATVHVCGLLHRDIKPGNFAVGLKGKATKVVYLLDFGMVRRYLKNGKVRPQRSSAAFRGSVQFASINAHRHIDLGRVDDYWCWLHTLIQLRTGKLPWRDFCGMRKVGMMKMKITKNELLQGMEPEYHVIYDNLQKLNYEDQPPLPLYRDQLTKILHRLSISYSEPFDWEMPERVHVEAKILPQKTTQNISQSATKLPSVRQGQKIPETKVAVETPSKQVQEVKKMKNPYDAKVFQSFVKSVVRETMDSESSVNVPYKGSVRAPKSIQKVDGKVAVKQPDGGPKISTDKNVKRPMAKKTVPLALPAIAPKVPQAKSVSPTEKK